jgi:hypothetical protein
VHRYGAALPSTHAGQSTPRPDTGLRPCRTPAIAALRASLLPGTRVTAESPGRSASRSWPPRRPAGPHHPAPKRRHRGEEDRTAHRGGPAPRDQPAPDDTPRTPATPSGTSRHSTTALRRSENRKVGGSTPPLATRSRGPSPATTRMRDFCLSNLYCPPSLTDVPDSTVRMVVEFQPASPVGGVGGRVSEGEPPPVTSVGLTVRVPPPTPRSEGGQSRECNRSMTRSTAWATS